MGKLREGRTADMSAICGTSDVERFRSLVGRRLGLSFDDTKLGFLGDVLCRRAALTRRPCAEYLSNLETENTTAAFAGVVEDLTVAETFFFRNSDQFRVFAEVCLPERLRAIGRRKSLRVLSAGCASGEEPYSLAITTRQSMPGSAGDVSILAVDVNPAVLAKAARARFKSWALRETPPDLRQQWFHPDGADFVLDDAVRSSVRFEERNLAVDDAGLWAPETYDVVFCRNVVMYFTPDSAQALIGRIACSLVPGGYLFLGHAETLRGLSQDFHLCHTHEAFYYQRKTAGEGYARELTGIPRVATVAAPHPGVALPDAGDSWVETIQKASARIQALTAPGEPPPARARQISVAKPRADLGVILELLKKERFADALEIVQALPPDAGQDPDTLLLHAVLLTHCGLLAQAEELCRKLVGIDDLNAGAHYVLALCREGALDCIGAVDHDQVAVYLDPGFAMPHLHLGLLARKSGDHEIARRELEQACLLLQREDSSRLLLFGGGFGREALVALCRAELTRCGGLSS